MFSFQGQVKGQSSISLDLNMLHMVGTILLFIKEMYGNKNKIFLGRERFQWSGGNANQLFILIWPN